MVVSQDITSDNHLFTFNEARNICHRFLPGDATYIHKHQTIYYPNNGGPEIEQYVYYSPNLANQFPASMFTDENGNQGKPGIIGLTMDYDAGSSTQFVDCGVQVGLQSN